MKYFGTPKPSYNGIDGVNPKAFLHSKFSNICPMVMGNMMGPKGHVNSTIRENVVDYCKSGIGKS